MFWALCRAMRVREDVRAARQGRSDSPFQGGPQRDGAAALGELRGLLVPRS